MMIDKQIQDNIILVCKDEPMVLAAYVFGSIAKGNANADSDLDVAILLDVLKEKPFQLLSFISALEKRTGCRTDVVVLNHSDELLKFEVRQHGKLVFKDQKKRPLVLKLWGGNCMKIFYIFIGDM